MSDQDYDDKLRDAAAAAADDDNDDDSHEETKLDRVLAAMPEKLEDVVTWNEMKNYYVNDGPKAIWIGIYVVLNVAVFYERFHAYAFTDDNAAVFDVFGLGLPLARGAAAGIKLNAAVILLTVMRNFLTFLRSTSIAKFLPLDKNIVFHRGIAWVLAFWVAVHMASHYINYMRLSLVSAKELRALLGFEPLMEDDPDDQITTREWAYGTIPGVTGHVLVLVMVFMYSSALASIRRQFFELFWYTHHGFIVFYLLLALHGFPGVLEPPTAWMWIIGPFTLYTIERLVRVWRGNRDTVLLLAVQHPSDVLELRMKKTDFHYSPGEYIFVACPMIAAREWHPATITSSPEQDFVSVHFRVVGDWTGELQNTFNPDKKLGVVAEDIATAPDGRAILRIDGPYGTASREVFEGGFKTVVLVGGGIGVTPFASILRSIRYQTEREAATGVQNMAIRKVYFYWLSRDATAFEWFSELLVALEKADQSNLLDINIYWTAKLDADNVRDVMRADVDAERDAVTGLQARTNYGRPNWSAIFDDIEQRHQGEEIGIFFCGPRAISKQLYKISREKTFESSTATKFVYFKENF